jgi:hypothetical protein
MRARPSFDAVRAAARSLPDVEECLYYGKPALKVHGDMFVCLASHRSAEPNSLVVRMDMDAREACIAEQPDIYYVTEHYRGYSAVLVRLPRVGRDALSDLVRGAYRFVSAKSSRPRTGRSTSSRRAAKR